MPTVSKPIADTIKDGNGHYADDSRVIRIVEYDNQWGGVGYGMIYEGQNPDMYRETEFVRNPRIYFEAKES